MAKCYYNGILLPELPTGSIYNYPWIRKNNDTGNYDLIFYQGLPNYRSDSAMMWSGINQYPNRDWYTVPIATAAEETAWTVKEGGAGGFGIDANRTVLWSKYDIPLGSNTATEIYFEGSDPIPESEYNPHTHSYTETVTTAATCTTAGVKTFTCECGNSYTEEIPPSHSFVNGACTVCGVAENYSIRRDTLENFANQARRLGGVSGSLTTAEMLEIFATVPTPTTE